MKLFQEGLPLYKGNLHMHTTGSDGVLTPEEALRIYRQHGYDFCAITDHEVVTMESCMCEGIRVLSGIEMGYELPGEEMHVVGVGVKPEIVSKAERIWGPQYFIDEVNAEGGCAILAHPAWSLLSPTSISGLYGLTAAEVYNSLSTEPRNAHRADASLLLDVAAAHGSVLPLVAVDDAHFYEGEHCRSYVMVQAEALEQEAILAALKAGKFYASQGPVIHNVEVHDNKLVVTCSPADTIIFYSNLSWVTGRCRKGKGMTEAVYDLSLQHMERFVRCEVIDAQGRSAWTNPIKLK